MRGLRRHGPGPPPPCPGARQTFPDTLVELARQLTGGERPRNGVQEVELLPVRELRRPLGLRCPLRLLLPRHCPAAERFRFRSTHSTAGESDSSTPLRQPIGSPSGTARPPRQPMASGRLPAPLPRPRCRRRVFCRGRHCAPVSSRPEATRGGSAQPSPKRSGKAAERSRPAVPWVCTAEGCTLPHPSTKEDFFPSLLFVIPGNLFPTAGLCCCFYQWRKEAPSMSLLETILFLFPSTWEQRGISHPWGIASLAAVSARPLSTSRPREQWGQHCSKTNRAWTWLITFSPTPACPLSTGGLHPTSVAAPTPLAASPWPCGARGG